MVPIINPGQNINRRPRRPRTTTDNSVLLCVYVSVIICCISVSHIYSFSLSLSVYLSRIIIRLQDPRTIRKIVSIDDRTVLAFAGLTADARVLINKVRVEAQSYRLTMEDAPSVDYLARYLARIQQRYTQQGGVRPFGIATLVAGVNDDDNGIKPYLYQTDPAGTHSRWKAQVIGGRNSKSLREFLEKQYQDLQKQSPQTDPSSSSTSSSLLTEDKCVRLAIQALSEVVDSGAKTMQVCVVRQGGVKVMLSESDIQAHVDDIAATTTTTMDEDPKPSAAE
jgi:20S proteasome subunit alpha 4